MESKLFRMINRNKHPKIEGWESVSDVAKMLGISSAAIHQRMIRKGIFPHRLGNQLAIKITDIPKLK